MSLARIRWLAAGAAVLVLLLGYASLNKTVTILADGQAVTLVTRGLTVGDALRTAGLSLAAGDKTAPARLALLSNQLVVSVQRAARIQLAADGEVYSTTSSERNLARLLAGWGVALGADDRVLLAGQPVDPDAELPEAPFLSLELRRAVSVTLLDGDERLQFASSAATLGAALGDQGIDLHAADRLQPGPETPLNAGLQATLTRAVPLQVQLGSQQVSFFAAAETVGQALAEAGLALQGLDYSEPAADQPLPADGLLRVVRVREEIELTQQIVPFTTEWVEDPEAELDSTTIIEPGQAGVSAARTRVIYEDGVEVARIEEDERVLSEPKQQVTGYGTRIVIRTEVVDGVEIEYYRKVTVFATYYTPCLSGVDTCLYGTSSGLPVQKGTIATYINWYLALRFTNVYVQGYGPGVIGDVGAYRDRSVPWIDLAFAEEDRPVAWSNRWVTMYFTTPVPAYIPPVWPP